ncbi:MAG: hypothetical protein AB7N76_20725 [Planctomycetota bacterium]
MTESNARAWARVVALLSALLAAGCAAPATSLEPVPQEFRDDVSARAWVVESPAPGPNAVRLRPAEAECLGPRVRACRAGATPQQAKPGDPVDAEVRVQGEHVRRVRVALFEPTPGGQAGKPPQAHEVDMAAALAAKPVCEVEATAEGDTWVATAKLEVTPRAVLSGATGPYAVWFASVLVEGPDGCLDRQVFELGCALEPR